jgi:hypothetical protein
MSEEIRIFKIDQTVDYENAIATMTTKAYEKHIPIPDWHNYPYGLGAIVKELYGYNVIVSDCPLNVSQFVSCPDIFPELMQKKIRIYSKARVVPVWPSLVRIMEKRGKLEAKVIYDDVIFCGVGDGGNLCSLSDDQLCYILSHLDEIDIKQEIDYRQLICMDGLGSITVQRPTYTLKF